MTDPTHRHPALVAFDLFREAYPDLFCHMDEEGIALASRIFCEGWLSAGIAVKNAVDGTK